MGAVIKSRALSACLTSFDTVEGTIDDVLKSFPDCVEQRFDTDAITLVLTEVFNNIVEHGGPSARTAPVSIQWTLAQQLRITIIDRGRAMPNETCPNMDLPDPTTLPEGGFGWGLIGLICSQVSYHRFGRQNHLTLVFDPRKIS